MLRRGLRHGCSAAAARWAHPARASPAAGPALRMSSRLSLPRLRSVGRGLRGGPDRGRGLKSRSGARRRGRGLPWGRGRRGRAQGPARGCHFRTRLAGLGVYITSMRAAPFPENQGRNGRGSQVAGDHTQSPESRANASVQQVLGPTLEDVEGLSPGAPPAVAASRKPSGA